MVIIAPNITPTKNAKYITSCSTSLKQWVERYVSPNAKEIKVIYNPLQKDFIKDASINPNIAESNNVFFAGTICDWKGAEDLIKACKILNDSGTGVKLKMAGKVGAYGENLKAQYASESWLQILGKLPQEELKELYSTSSVVCFPSWWENMPMVCIEAMLCGAVVIGSNSGGMSEIIEDGKSGFLMTPRDPMMLANKIKEVCMLPLDAKAKVRKEAHKRIMQNFDMKVIIPQMVDYYQMVIDNDKKQK